MTAATNENKPQEQNLRDVLINTSVYLDGLLASVKSLEELLLLKLAQTEPCPAKAFNVQLVDFLTQSLEETGRLLERIAEEVPSNLSISADRTLNPIKLRVLKDQILTAQSHRPDHYIDRLAADVELF